MENLAGSCLCGDVTYEIKNDFKQFHFCHCAQCQKISGSAHVANLFAKPDAITWKTGEDKVKRYDLPGRLLSKAFCKNCGCSVPFLSRSGKFLIVPAGSLDGTPNIDPQDIIFWHERATWYEAGVDSKRFDGFPK